VDNRAGIAANFCYHFIYGESGCAQRSLGISVASFAQPKKIAINTVKKGSYKK
jgi:hypothetical protein